MDAIVPDGGAHVRQASNGALDSPFTPREESSRRRAALRRRLAEGARGTFIGEMLVARDSALARWPDRASPLRVWIQPTTTIAGWRPTYVRQVRAAFSEWDVLGIPVHFTLATDSAGADVHVTFVHHFDEPISGRTRWARDDQWWITDADIALAVHHRGGPLLDDDAVRAMAMHEIGHLLGLDHTLDQSSIMAPKVRVRALASVDRATIRLLYALPPGRVR